VFLEFFMRFLACFLLVTCSFLAVSGAYAQDKGDKKKPADALDPVSGTVPTSDVPHYDIFERRIRYKKTDKEFRESIEARRIAYEEPRTAHYAASEDKIAKIYESETKSYQDAVNKEGKDKDKAPTQGKGNPPWMTNAAPPEDKRPIVPIGEPGDGMEHAPEDLKKQASVAGSQGAEQPKVGVKEIDVQETGVDDAPRKKIIVPEDAPEFGNSPFDE
jgi:hypothetical protein